MNDHRDPASIAGELARLSHSRLDAAEIAAFEIDGRRPVAVAQPLDSDEVCHWLKECNSQKAVVNIWGKGQHQQLGGRIAAHDLALSTRALDKIVEYEPENLTVSVQSGVTLGTLQLLAAPHKQFLPLNPPLASNCTLGGIFAANAYGSFAHRYGTARDYLLGAKVVTADGQEIKFGGKTVKNVAGYDLGKLYIGSMGTLGVLTELTCKLQPKPPVVIRVSARIEFGARLAEILTRINQTSLPVCAVTLHGEMPQPSAKTEFDLRLSVEEFSGDSNAFRKKIAELLSGLDVQISATDPVMHPDEYAEHFFACTPQGVLTRWNLPKSAIVQAIAALRESATAGGQEVQMFSYPGRGVVCLKIPSVSEGDIFGIKSILATWREMAHSLGGSMQVERSPVSLKSDFDVWGVKEPQLNWYRKIKKEFDPNGVLAGGRFVGGI